METLDHPVVIGHHRDEWFPLSVVIEPHVDRGLYWPTQLGVIDDRTEARDHASVDQPLDPGTSRVGTQTHQTAELAMTDTTICIE